MNIWCFCVLENLCLWSINKGASLPAGILQSRDSGALRDLGWVVIRPLLGRTNYLCASVAFGLSVLDIFRLYYTLILTIKANVLFLLFWLCAAFSCLHLHIKKCIIGNRFSVIRHSVWKRTTRTHTVTPSLSPNECRLYASLALLSTLAPALWSSNINSKNN